jgi:hypothetical protein
MNYKLIYDNIITRAKTRNIEGYSEKHHIIPKCLGGIDDKSNIVKLTAKEHFVCHQLLVKIHPTIGSLVYAAWMMSNTCNNKQQRLTGKIYAWLRQKHARTISTDMKGKRTGKTLQEITNNPNYVDPRRGKTMVEIYGKDHKHPQAQPFIITSHTGVVEYSCTKDFVRRTGMVEANLQKLKTQGSLLIKRRKNTRHIFKDSELISIHMLN